MMKKLLSLSLLVGSLSFVATPASAAVCSPVESTVNGDKVLTFTNTTACDWTLPLGVTTFKVLVVGGGGGGGADGGSGGGGGAIYAGTINRSTDTNRKITVTVGAGGAGVFHTPNAAGGAGTSSTLVYTDQNSQTLTLTSSGGGVGVWGGPTDATYAGGSGGSTPTISDNSTLISITDIIKSAGGNGGNGVNFESTSAVPGNGTGGTSSITEFSGSYGGGAGGGATQKTPTDGRPGGTGSNGGGNGAGGLTGARVSNCATSGTTNSGGGGGGGSAHGDVANCLNEAYPSRNGKSGAAGVVKIRYTPVTVPTNPSSFSSSESVANTVTVAITAPNDGGSAITNYQYSFDEATWVDYSPATGPGNVTLTFDTSARAFAPTTFYFKAVNEVGASKSSWDVTASSRSKVTMYTGGQNSLPFVTTNDAPSGTKMSGSTLGNGLGIIGKPSASISRQWQSCTSSTDLTSCSNIAGATSNTYVLTDSEVGKYIRTKVTGTNTVGTTIEYSPLTSAVSAFVDSTAPTITNLSSPTSNGTYKTGDTISIQANFSENVTVTGTPRLTLETGSTDRAIDYASGSGSGTLTFTYTVQAGDTSADLDYISTSALELNSGTIKDAAGNNAVLTLASPGASNSLGGSKAIVIDGVTPTVSVTPGSVITSANVSVRSTEIGTAYLVHSSVSVTNLASITSAADNLWNSVSITAANTATDLAGTGLTTGVYTLYSVDAAGNVSSGVRVEAITAAYFQNFFGGPVSGASPRVSGTTATLANGETFTVSSAYWLDSTKFNGSVTNTTNTVNHTPPAAWGGIKAPPTSPAAPNFLFNGTNGEPPAGQNDFFISPSFTVSSNVRYTISFSLIEDNNVSPINVQPRVNGSALNNSSGILQPATATTSWANYSYCWDSGSSTSAQLHLGDNSVGGTGNDFAITNIKVAISSTCPQPAPAVTSVTSSKTNGAYKVGEVISIQVLLSEAVVVTGTPQLTLETGSTDRVLDYTSGGGTDVLIFQYTVQAGDTSSDLDYVSTSSLELNGGSIKNSSNTDAVLTLASPGGAGSLGANKALVIDTTAPNNPATPDLEAASDLGSSTSDNLTSDNTPTINVSGSFSGNAVVAATKAGSTTVTCTISSNVCTLGTLADGVWSLTVTDTDAAGNATTSAALSITVDATVPTPTVTTASVTTSSGVTVRSSKTGTAYLVKSSVAVSNLASITGASNDNYNEVAIATANTDTMMSTTGLVAGEYKLYVADAAGNLSSASSNTVTVAVAAAPTSNSTAAPTGTTTFGSTLTSAVTFNGVPSPTLSYQWKSCTNATDTATVCSDISGATGPTFIANVIDLVGKYIRVFVTAINGESPDATAWSSPTAAITAVAPGVPTLGTPTLGDLQINVPVTAPASNGGSTITKYQFSTDGGATWMDRTDTATVSSPIVIKFLSTDGTTPIVAGTTYPVQIRAVNSASSPNGLGTTSVSVVAATAPGAPTAVSATATGQSTATVSFTAPTSNGGSAITSYMVTSSPGGVTATGSSSPISVTGLTASTAYTFTVTASNAAATSVASTASTSVTTSAAPAAPVAPVAPPAPEPAPEPVCNAACIAAQAAAAKAIADKIASDTAAKVVADKVVVDKRAAEAAAKVAIDKAAAAAVAKAAADLAALQAATIAKAAADAQAAANKAAAAAQAALKNSTASAAAKAAATASAARAAAAARAAVKAAATAAQNATKAKTAEANANKQVDIAIGALGSKTAAAASAAQANAIAAAAKAAANEAAKVAADQAAAAKVASNNANREATSAAARIATEQKEAADAAAQAKAATDAVLKATEEKIAAATEAQKSAEAVVKALEEKIALAEASVKAEDVTERAAIEKKIEEVSAKVAEVQRVADAANARAEATVAAQENAQAVATAATQQAQVQAAEAVTVRAESTAKNAAATKAAADASLAAKIASAAKAAAAKVPSRAVIAAKPGTTGKNSAKATISGLKPGQKVKVTVNVKDK